MLKKLHIEQFVIIDTLDLQWQPGLTILTGETGAGKSILLDAMGLVLGEQSDMGTIRNGSEQAVIEATIALPANHPAWAYINQHALPHDPAQDFKIRRVLNRDAAETIQFNGHHLDRETLEGLGQYLVEIHGQFANQGLMDPDNQLKLLDASGGFPPEVFQNVANALRDVKKYAQALEEEKLFLARHKAKGPEIERIVGIFNEFEMKRGRIEEVESEHARLRTAKETSEALQSILGRFIAASGIVVALSGANQTLERQQNLDQEKVAKLSEHLTASLNHARSVVKEIGLISPEYEIDTGPLNYYAGILATLKKLSADYKIPFEGLTDFYEDMDTKLNRLRAGRQTLADLETKLADAKATYREHAQVLTQKRIAAADALSKTVTAELPPLKLERAEFQVKVEEKPDLPWTDRGLNVVTFTARMNPGQPFSSISDTASGGELARLMLALKVVVQAVQTTETLVFDEVDTGIGGAAASAVGERLAQLAEKTQVMVITHSPQVAARGEHHLHVSKKTDGITTTSVVRTLTHEQRIDEISRMLSGDELTSESTAAAKRLIDEAANATARRRQA